MSKIIQDKVIEITKEFVNPERDGRNKRDWQKQTYIKKGLRLRLLQFDNERPVVYSIYHYGSLVLRDDDALSQLILENHKEVEPTGIDLIMISCYSSHQVIDWLLKNNKIELGLIRQAIEALGKEKDE